MAGGGAGRRRGRPGGPSVLQREREFTGEDDDDDKDRDRIARL